MPVGIGHLGDQAFVYEVKYDAPFRVRPKAIKARLASRPRFNPCDPLGRANFVWEIVEIDDTFPHLVHEEPHSFDAWIIKPSQKNPLMVP